jgi:hypothetical protein
MELVSESGDFMAAKHPVVTKKKSASRCHDEEWHDIAAVFEVFLRLPLPHQSQEVSI